MVGKARLLQLADDLRQEIEAFDRVVLEARQTVSDFADRSPNYLELRGAGDIVHDFYNAVERYLERVAIEMNGGLPAGADSHARLLAAMARDLKNVRPAVLRPEVKRRLDEYLRFRHLFRHRYGFELRWDRLVPLLQEIHALSADLRSDLVKFSDLISELANRLP